MKIEFRRILGQIKSHKVTYNLTLKHELLLEFDYIPDNDKEPFVFSGKQLLEKCNLPEDAFFKGYFVGVEKEGEITKIHILENQKFLLTVNKNLNFSLKDVILLPSS